MIGSASNRKVKQIIQWQTKARERREAGVFLIEGFKLYEEAPEEDIKEVYLAQNMQDRVLSSPTLREKLSRTGYETVAEEVFRKMSDTQTPQGILCVVRRPVYTLEQMLDAPSPLLMILEDIQDPGNLGTIVRTGEGAGITGVIASRKTVDLFNSKTIRSTMGSVFRVPFLYVESLEEMVGLLHRRKIKVYAAHLEGEKYYDSFSYESGTAFLIGNEGNGLSRGTASLADACIRIPMEGKVESLNAAVAASLLMYEAHRQRQRHP